MGNSPEICRRHYAALIPEDMRDTVEFESREKTNEDGEDMKVMLKQVLNELRGTKDSETKPKLRLIKE